MKRILTAIALLACITGCIPTYVEVSDDGAEQVRIINTKVVKELKIRGHYYLSIPVCWNYDDAIVHDPDCPTCKANRNDDAGVN